MDKIGVGLIGFGAAGRVFHAPLIKVCPQLTLRKIVSSNTSNDQLIADTYQGAIRLTNTEEVFADESISLVVIATPNHTHYKLASSALQHGKHVVIDKPVTTTTVEANKLIELAKKQSKILSVFKNRRWDGDFLTVEKLLNSGRLGPIVQFKSNFDRFRPVVKLGWRELTEPGAGILYDLGAHLIDQALQLFGWPLAVNAHIARQRPGVVADDYFNIQLYYPGMLAQLSAGQLASVPSSRFSILGQKAGYQVMALDPQEAQLKTGTNPAHENFGKANPENWGNLYTQSQPEGITMETLPGNYKAFYSNIGRAINNAEPLAVTAEQARDVVSIIELAQKSHKLMRTIAA